MFNEICIYEAKLTKINEIEQLMKEVAEFYQQREGIIDVHYIKRIICTPSGIFAPASGYIARCAPFIRENSPTKCDAQLPENNFKTRSRM